MTYSERISDLQNGLELRWDAICKLQAAYCKKLLTENLEGNLATAGTYLEIIKDLQNTLEDI